MARSAPMARPVRSCSCAVFWPIESRTTSVPAAFSLIRSASSMAISSKGLITHLTLSVTIDAPSGVSLMTVSGSGTRLTHTRIFTTASPIQGAENQSICGAGAASEVEAETARELATCLHDERRHLFLDPFGSEAVGGTDDRECADDGARVVADRRRDGAYVLDVLPAVDSVAGGGDAAQLLEERLPIGHGAFCEAREAVWQQRAERIVGLECQQCLPRRGAVQGQSLAEWRDDPHRAVRLDHFDRHDGVATEDGDVGRLADLADEGSDDRPRLMEEAHVLHVALAELQAA